VWDQFHYYTGHVLTNIGGIYETPKSASQSGPVYQMVPLAVQKEALSYLKENIFATPKWLLDTTVLSRVGESPTQLIAKSQDMALNHLLSAGTLSKLSVSEAMYGDKAYRLIDYFNDIDNAIWGELKSHSAIDIYRRNLQRSYIDRLIELSHKSGKDYRDVSPLVKMKLVEIRGVIKKAMGRTKDSVSQYHLKFIYERLEDEIKA
jgi:hypothetical protein